MKPYIVTIISIFVLKLIYIFWPITKNASKNIPSDNSLTAITLPKTLTTSTQSSKRIYNVKCAHCRGINAVGQHKVEPPLIHKIYESNHRGDENFHTQLLWVYQLIIGRLDICRQSKEGHGAMLN